MKIIELEAAGVRALRDGTWSLEPARGNLTVVTGPPSVGVTSFLDAIAFTAGLLSVGGTVPSADDALRAGESTARIRSVWELDEAEREFGGTLEETSEAVVSFRRGALGRADADPALLGLMSRYDHRPELSKVVNIPERRLVDGSLPAFSDFEVDQRYKHLSPAADKFSGVPYALVRHWSGFGEKARFDDVKRLFSELCDTVSLAGVGSVGDLLFSLPSGPQIPLHRLGFVERNAFILAAVPVLLGLERSVILLDTPEMGLGPGIAGRWLSALRGYAPAAQWIVGSRDPSVLESAPPACRIELARMGS